MTDDIALRLEKLEASRLRLTSLLRESQYVIGAIEETIQELNERQELRMRADDRLDAHVVNKVVQGSLLSVASDRHDLPRRQSREFTTYSRTNA